MPPFATLAIIAAFIDPILLAWAWFWALRAPQTLPSWRYETGRLGLIAASLAGAAQLVFAFAAAFDMSDLMPFALLGMGIMAAIGLLLGTLGKGSFRIASVLTSVFMLVLSAMTLGTAGH
jgi:hypothetical protein